MKRLLSTASNWKLIVPFFILFCLATFVVFPAYHQKMVTAAGKEFQILDTRFSYSITDVRTLFNDLGTEGRQLYRFVVGRVDMIYPVIYGTLMVLVLAFLIRKMTKPDSSAILIALLPLAGALFDYLENFNTLSLLSAFPDLAIESVTTGEKMTQLKQGILFLSLGLIIVLTVILGIRKLRNRNSHRQEQLNLPI
ncbi:MAG TPA: hypothetical protein VD993_09100 [Chitinophagaceae bacterium]|nr:hypothetical protein [Chitinophagaceae bacterium]